jgi:hypothetical protein
VDPANPDRVVLVASVGPEILAALLVLAIGVAGTAVGVIMARRGRVEALSLAGVFGLVILGAIFALAHLPTRLSVDRNGIDVALWIFRQQRGWPEIASVDVRRDRFGTWFRFAERAGESTLSAIWPPRAGFLIGSPPLEIHQLVMRIDAWRLAPQPPSSEPPARPR